MSWTLLMADEDGTPFEECSVILDDELAAYLVGIEGFPFLRGLRGMDRFEETWIDEAARDALGRGRAGVATEGKHRNLPEPPEWVGLERAGDRRLGEELGWPGLLDFLQRLE